MAPRERSKPPTLSEEYVVDSSDDEDVARSGPTEHHGKKKVPETPSKQKKVAKINERPKSPTDSPSTESSSSSPSTLNGQDDGEGEDEDELEVAGPLYDNAKQDSSKTPSKEELPRKNLNTSPAVKRAIAPKQYFPPAEFLKLRATVEDSGAPHAQFLLTNHLEGKEVWHIIAPANLSMESIKPFAIRAAMRGEPILNSEGKVYCLEDGLSSDKCTLAPNDTADAYVPGQAAVSRTFRLQEIINAPTKDKGSKAKQSKQMYFEFQPHDEYPLRKKRKQPEGLRMRYKPFGTTDALQEQSEAGRPNIIVPDEIPSPQADHRAGKQKKSHENWRSSTAEADSGVTELDPSEIPSVTHKGSPKSRESSKMIFSAKNIVEASSAMQQKTKRSKKNKNHEAERT